MMCMSPGTSQDNRSTIAPTERHHLTCLAKYWLSSWWLLSTCREMMASDDRLSSRFSIASSVGKARRWGRPNGSITVKLSTCGRDDDDRSIEPRWRGVRPSCACNVVVITTRRRQHVPPSASRSCPHVSETPRGLPGRSAPRRQHHVTRRLPRFFIFCFYLFIDLFSCAFFLNNMKINMGFYIKLYVKVCK